ncbi:hypothetical protein O181_077159 [Austropuccinia psidii MF-1]|uniref:Uncharacterized protein n=1 Tax=Austropuccinia psidii MF-1 TaxID=1389203 RepID=A0A9Q3IG30_9BASI|nr:hypothetical protein [Austropuccinia psidii MF-1]
MTPTRSGSNYPIQSNVSGPGHSSHKTKGQDCQPRGEAQMEDTRVSTSSQRQSSTDKSLVEEPKHVVRGPEEEVGPRKGQQPSGSYPSLHKQKSGSSSAKKGKASLKEQSEGQSKGKGKGKDQVEQALPTEIQNSQER